MIQKRDLVLQGQPKICYGQLYLQSYWKEFYGHFCKRLQFGIPFYTPAMHLAYLASPKLDLTCSAAVELHPSIVCWQIKGIKEAFLERTLSEHTFKMKGILWPWVRSEDVIDVRR